MFRLRELFAMATPEEKIVGLAALENIKQQDVNYVFRKKFYENYIDKEFLDQFADLVWFRISSLKKFFRNDIKQYLSQHQDKAQTSVKLPSEKILVRPIDDFLKTTTKIDNGWAKPKIYQKIPKNSVYKKYQNVSRPILQNAVLDNDLAVVGSLIKDGIDVNIRDNKGHTALVYALRNQNEAMILLLLKNGAFKNSRVLVSTEKLLHLAAKIDNAEIFERVYQLYEKDHTRYKNNKTAYDIAEENNCHQVLKIYDFIIDTRLLTKLCEECGKIRSFVLLKVENISHADETQELLAKSFLEKLSSFKFNDLRYTAGEALQPILLLIEAIENELQQREQKNLGNTYDFYE